tara:strand:+ start:190 stop:471 length:282 start_codon:yes stop_codon:yes gene_type:complete
MDFLEVFNIVIAHTTSRADNAKDATSFDDGMPDLGLDSLDMVMVVAVLTDAYGIPQDMRFDDVNRVTVGTIQNYINDNKTREPDSIEHLLEYT